MPRSPGTAPRRRLAALAGLAAFALPLLVRPGANAETFTSYHENVMGTSMRLDVEADAPDAAARAEAAALAEIDRLSRIFSGYNPASEFRRWQAGPGGPVKVSPELFEVLRLSDRWREATGGAFDPRVERLSRLWAEAAARGREPSDEEREAARPRPGQPAWRLDPTAGTAERLSEAPVTLNAIAKGYIVEKACQAALRGAQVKGVALNVGGDLRLMGAVPSVVGIAPPRGDSETTEPVAHVEAPGRAVSTSGDARRGFDIAGRWYSHVIDPRTGRPASAAAGVTVIADRSADADALSTALNVLGPEQGIRLAETLPGVEALFVRADGTTRKTAGWGRFERPAPRLAASGKAKAPPETPEGWWGADHEVVVDLEINNPDTRGERYRRPYVAVWVENAEGFPVRNLAIWVSFGGAGPYQWIPDLKRWYRADAVRRKVDKTDMIATVARPTRKPGKYDLIWDGRDDRQRPLPAGRYTVCIDAAREHGTYQSMRQALTVGGPPSAAELKGNVEIKGAAVTYRNKAAAR